MTVEAEWLVLRANEAEMNYAGHVGVLRHIHALRSGYEDKNNGQRDDGWTRDIDGAIAEQQVCKWLGVYWHPTIGDIRRIDIDDRFQCKCTGRRWTDGIIRKSDPEEYPYIFVISFCPVFKVTGWLWGYEARQPQWWREGIPGRPAWFVPVGEHRSIETLPLDWFPAGDRRALQ
jgi:hypothetical protein